MINRVQLSIYPKMHSDPPLIGKIKLENTKKEIMGKMNPEGGGFY
jgi:hypothetical protein